MSNSSLFFICQLVSMSGSALTLMKAICSARFPLPLGSKFEGTSTYRACNMAIIFKVITISYEFPRLPPLQYFAVHLLRLEVMLDWWRCTEQFFGTNKKQRSCATILNCGFAFFIPNRSASKYDVHQSTCSFLTCVRREIIQHAESWHDSYYRIRVALPTRNL